MIKSLWIIPILILVGIVLLIFIYGKNEAFSDMNVHVQTKIPKIIHQTAPTDVKKWPKKWIECQKTWKDIFPETEYTHIMWTDEDLDEFIRDNFPWFYGTFKNYPKNIQRVDTARYFILYKFGGIYADMDFECKRNFYDQLIHKNVNIAESPYKQNENLHNSLMASPPRHPFWGTVFKCAEQRRNMTNVLSSTGPRLLDAAYEEYTLKTDPKSATVTILPASLYNPHKDKPEFKDPNVYTRHHLTSVWNDKKHILYT